jgi:hypothetical protein
VSAVALVVDTGEEAAPSLAAEDPGLEEDAPTDE